MTISLKATKKVKDGLYNTVWITGLKDLDEAQKIYNFMLDNKIVHEVELYINNELTEVIK